MMIDHWQYSVFDTDLFRSMKTAYCQVRGDGNRPGYVYRGNGGERPVDFLRLESSRSLSGTACGEVRRREEW
jgi:hypothetical protein